MVLKRTEMFVFGGGTLCMLSPDSSCQHDVPFHDGNSPGMDGTQVGIIKQPDKVCLCCFLGDTVSLPTGTAGLSCSPGRSPSPTSGKAISG